MSNIVPEGLAINFEKDIRKATGVFWEDKPWYFKENNREEIMGYLRDAIDICENKKEYSYNAWMYNFDNENPEFPQNLGYKIGDFLVKEYCNFYNINSIDAVRTSTMEFVRFAKKEILKCEK